MGTNDDSKYLNINEYYGDLNVLSKYPKNKKEDNNSDNEENDNVYDLIENDNKSGNLIQNKELIIPLDENEDDNKENKDNKKDFTFFHNKINNGLMFEGLFNNSIY